MEYDNFDDGLVHNHDWASLIRPEGDASAPIADASGARTPSTVYHDDHFMHG